MPLLPRGLACVFLLLVALGLPSTAGAVPPEKLAPYTYEDTKALVGLVEDAAALVEREGEAAFPSFGVEGSRWLTGQFYIFVYALDGTCAFHPVAPELIGKNLIGLKDMDGKPVIQRIVDIGKEPARDASGWVFYLWEDQTQLIPNWKSAYIRKVVAPDHKVYLVGSGIYEIKIERVFVEQQVSRACDLLRSQGKDAAFAAFNDRASIFNFLDTYIFVLNSDGQTLVDPAYPNLAGRDLSHFRDVVGFEVIKEVLRKLAGADEAWVQYLWPRPGNAMPSRKLIYARKVKVGNETLIVGSDFFLATPIWMKVEKGPAWRENPPA